ncbi:unnamed protein product, partial [Meganyctiphanes norvegica]
FQEYTPMSTCKISGEQFGHKNSSKRKFADIVRVGTGGGLCFCGLNMYFKNDKFYDDFVMPIFDRMDPETAHNVATQAAKYNLVPKDKLESKLLVSTQPTSSYRVNADSDTDDTWSIVMDQDYASQETLLPITDTEDTCNFSNSLAVLQPIENSINVHNNQDFEEESTSINTDFKSICDNKSCVHDRTFSVHELRGLDSPKRERNCATPDSPSLSMKVNIDSPLRRSKMSLTTMVDGVIGEECSDSSEVEGMVIESVLREGGVVETVLGEKLVVESKSENFHGYDTMENILGDRGVVESFMGETDLVESMLQEHGVMESMLLDTGMVEMGFCESIHGNNLSEDRDSIERKKMRRSREIVAVE